MELPLNNNKITISGWYGRLGNNIWQIANALVYCEVNKYNFYCPPHPLINSFSVPFGMDVNGTTNFFENNNDFYVEEAVLNANRRKVLLEYFLPNFKITPSDTPAFISDLVKRDDVVVAHVRGGDVFLGSPHSHYIQNPLWWYEYLLQRYDKMVLVTEDDSNPVVSKLSCHPKVICQSGSISEDFATLLSAQNLASGGFGTFVGMAAMCSNNIRVFHATNYFEEDIKKSLDVPDIKYEEYQLKGYIAEGQWENTEAQREIMLKYPQSS